jgi:TPR repeat protein
MSELVQAWPSGALPSMANVVKPSDAAETDTANPQASSHDMDAGILQSCLAGNPAELQPTPCDKVQHRILSLKLRDGMHACTAGGHVVYRFRSYAAKMCSGRPTRVNRMTRGRLTILGLFFSILFSGPSLQAQTITPGVATNPEVASKKAHPLPDRKQCDSGNAKVCDDLGLAYETGDNVASNSATALLLFNKSCTAGLALGCTHVGMAYVHAPGATKNFVQAATFFRKGCDGGDPMGCTNLGVIYERGLGVAKNATTAEQLYDKACQLGDADSCTKLGNRYSLGDLAANDFVKAAEYFLKGCNAGGADACRGLGLAYEQGEGVPRDMSRAVTLYKKSCDGDSSWGCGNLALSYEKGAGLPKDLNQALTLYKKACKLGSDPSCDKVQAINLHLN